jgi:hypothetical protein
LPEVADRRAPSSSRFAARSAQDLPRYGDELYQPRLRQPARTSCGCRRRRHGRADADDGEDDERRRRLRPGRRRRPAADCGAQKFGAKAVGIEYDRDLAALARRNAERAGVAGKVTIVQGDIFKEDFTRATVLTLYLLPDLNQQLRPRSSR